jgi:hypothetical protein
VIQPYTMALKKLIFSLLSGINYFHRNISVFHFPDKKVVLPGSFLEFNPEEKIFLEQCAASYNYDVDYSRGYRQREVSFSRLQDATLLANSGGVVLHHLVPYSLVTESVMDLQRLGSSRAWRMPDLLISKRKKGIYTAIFHLPWANTSNYHWFFDSLPRLYALLKTVDEPVTLAVPEFMPLFQQETLAFLLQDFPNFRMEKIKKYEKWRCETFLLPSFVNDHYSGYLPRPVSDFLREEIWKGYKVGEKQPDRRIYISRSKSAKRRILNEAELLPILEKNGFEVVYPEFLTYRDQVQLFYESRYIVAAHGAGLTNTFFAQKATVLELHPEEIVKSHYFLLCKGLGFDYHYVVGSKADANLDFTVPVGEVEELIGSFYPDVR